MTTNRRRARELVERLVALDNAGIRVTCQWVKPGGVRFSCPTPGIVEALLTDFREELELLGHYYILTLVRPLWMQSEREAVMQIADLFGFPPPQYTRVDLVVT